MNDLEKELRERESKLEKSIVNVNWQEVFPSLHINELYKFPTEKQTIKPNLIKHNNNRWNKLLIIRTNKNKTIKNN